MARNHSAHRPRGVTILSILFLVMAAINVLVGLGVALGGPWAVGWFESFVGALTGGALTALGVGVLLLGIIQLVVGWGLWTMRSWARTAAIVFAIVGLLSFPIGTILSAIVLVYLFQPEVRDAFEEEPARTGRAVPERRRV